jgi:beta-glucanase (GH16 family)
MLIETAYTNFTDWPKQTITWYLNGQQTQQITGAQIGDYNTWVNVSRLPLYLIANIAIGGAFPGEPTSATLGGLNSGMFLRYVGVYMTN